MQLRLIAFCLSCLFGSWPVHAGVEIVEGLPFGKDRAKVIASRVARLGTPAEVQAALKMYYPLNDGDVVLALAKSPHANMSMRVDALLEYVHAMPNQVKAQSFDRDTLEGFLDLANDLGLYSLLEASEDLLAKRSPALIDVLQAWYLSRLSADQLEVLRDKTKTGSVFLLLNEALRQQKSPLRRLRACLGLL